MRAPSISAVILVASLFGCAAHAPLPAANTVCLVIDGIGDPESPFVRRKAALYLAEAGFHLVEANCDLTVIYTNFNSGEWEVLERSLFGTKSSNAWRAEGVVALRQGVATIVEDESIDLRDHSTQQELLADLASEIVEVVTNRYQATAQPNH